MTFAQRKSLPRPETGQTLLAGREKEIGLYRLHFHRAKDNPEVRLITSISGPGGVGKSRLLDDLEWHCAAGTIYGRVDDSAGFGHDAVRLLRAIADALQREGEAIPTPHFDRLYQRRQELFEKALTRSRDPKQVRRHFYRPTLLGLDRFGLEQPLTVQVEPEQFTDLRWSEADLALAFENPLGLLTQALITDLNEIVLENQANGSGGEAQVEEGSGDIEHEAEDEAGEAGNAEQNVLPKSQSPTADPQSPALTLPSGSRFQKPKPRQKRPGEFSETPTSVTDPTTGAQAQGKRYQSPITLPSPTKIVLMFDSYELIQPVVGEWLLTYLLGHGREAIECDLRLVIAGRDDLLATDERWQPWSDYTLSLPLEPFSSAEISDFIKKNVAAGRPDVHLEEAVTSAWPPRSSAPVPEAKRVEGPLPLWLNVAETAGAAIPDSSQPLKELLSHFSESQKRWLQKAALLGRFDQGRLTALVGNQEGRTAFKWLVSQQNLVRASSVAGQFILDRTLAEALRAETADDCSADRQTLLAYLDQELALLRKDLQKPAPRGSQIHYRALLLERLRHTLSADQADAVEQFMPATFLEALDTYPPLMFDLLAIVEAWKDEQEGSPSTHFASGTGAGEQGSHGEEIKEAESKASITDDQPRHRRASAGQTLLITNLQSLAGAWLSGHWAQMQPVLAVLVEAEKVTGKPKAIAYNWWGYSYRAMEQPDRALEIYDQGLALQADDALLRLDRGVTHFNLAHYREAIADFSQALNPGQPVTRAQRSVLHHTRGLAYAHLAEYVEAVDDYSQAIRLDPDNGPIYSDRGLAFVKQGNHERAIEDYNQAIQLNAADAVAHFYRGLAYADQKIWDKAIQDYDRAIELRPAYSQAFQQRALAYMQQNELTQAIADFNRAIALNPQDPANYRQRGLAYVQQGRFEQAVDDFDRAIRLDPADRISYFNLGQAYLRQGDPGRAVRNFDRALEGVSGGAEAQRRRGAGGSFVYIFDGFERTGRGFLCDGFCPTWFGLYDAAAGELWAGD